MITAIRKRLLLILCSAVLLLTGCGSEHTGQPLSEDIPKGTEAGERRENGMEKYEHISLDDSIYDVIDHPAFQGYGHLIFPWDDTDRYAGLTMRDAPSLHIWHTNMDAAVMVDGVNRMIDDLNDGKTVFYDFYSEQEKADDPTKILTGMFFFRGDPGAPFAVMCPGGGFYYVGSLHEGFPIAMELNKKGYNVFVLKYRALDGRITPASRDLIAAVDFIQSHAQELEVSPDNYSLWGGSAGAAMVSDVSYGETLKRRELIRPAAGIMAYTTFEGHPRFSSDDPPGFTIVGTRDWIVPYHHVEKRFAKMRRIGIDVECIILENMPHGFGVGTGTAAEGWIDKAVDFWERHMD